MQFKAIIVLALAAAVSAVPAGDLEARTGSTCASGLSNSCCNSFQKLSLFGIAVPINLGVGCILNVLGNTCTNQAACCQASTSSQSGLVNIGGLAVCPNVAA